MSVSKEAMAAANDLAQTLHMELEDESCRADRDDIARALDAFAAERVAEQQKALDDVLRFFACSNHGCAKLESRLESCEFLRGELGARQKLDQARIAKLEAALREIANMASFEGTIKPRGIAREALKK